MERWRRLAAAGAASAGLLCAGLVLAASFYNAGSLALARWRWAQRGSLRYTVVVTQRCNCYQNGAFELTVAGGQVIAARPAGGQPGAPSANPARFAHLTVEASFARAARNLRDNWRPDLRSRNLVEYDPGLGYVTRLESGDPAVPHFYFVYSARDLQTFSP